MYKIILLTYAIKDIESACEWYSQRQLDLHLQFNKSIFDTIEKLNSEIIKYPPIYRGLSRVLVELSMVE